MLINTLFKRFDIAIFVSCNDPSKVILYSFKPIASANDGDNNSEGKVHQQSFNNSRIGNIGRCKCNNFRQTETDTEKFHCAEADEIRKDMFKV